jgi:predicted nucleic acid-binding protein
MNWLLDVNLILASRWTTHPDHLPVKAWIESVGEFSTCAISELGFVRISLSTAYQATWAQVQEALGKLHSRPGYRIVADDVDGAASPETNSKDTTDAHLVTLAQRHGLKLATLDEVLLSQPWAVGLAANPLLPPPALTTGA